MHHSPYFQLPPNHSTTAAAGGVGRSGAVAFAYLLAAKGWDLETTQAYISRYLSQYQGDVTCFTMECTRRPHETVMRHGHMHGVDILSQPIWERWQWGREVLLRCLVDCHLGRFCTLHTSCSNMSVCVSRIILLVMSEALIITPWHSNITCSVRSVSRSLYRRPNVIAFFNELRQRK
jgi:hypothetical protein